MSNRHNPIQSKKNNLKQQIVSKSATATFYSGVLPQSDELLKYEQVLPGLADRIMKQAEKQTDHRIKQEDKVIRSGNFRATLGTTFGFILGMSGITAGTYLMSLGLSGEGLASFFGSLGTLLWAYLKGIKSNKEERESRRNK